MSMELIELVKNGQICESYGSTYLISVNPAFGIDRVRFSAVKIGSKGALHNDIYLTTEEFRILCAEIDNGTALRKIENDKGNYPSAYIYTKGEDGCKKLAIGGGQKGVRIQITNPGKDGKSSYMLSVVQYSDLQTMSFLYKLFSGLIPVTPGSYYGKIYETYWANAGKFKPKDYDEKADGAYHTTEEATINPSTNTIYNTVSNGEAYTDGDYTIIPVIVGGDTPAKLGFHKKIIANLSWFNQYLTTVAAKATNLNVKAEAHGNCLVFQALA